MGGKVVVGVVFSSAEALTPPLSQREREFTRKTDLEVGVTIGAIIDRAHTLPIVVMMLDTLPCAVVKGYSEKKRALRGR
jgi:hypothetical protein